MGTISSFIGVRSATRTGDASRHEAAIVTELRAGSEEAFAWLIGQFHQPVYSLIARTIHDQADAADITQDVFIKIFRGIGDFNGASSLRTWIYRIALHEAYNRRRWWSRHKAREIAMEAEIHTEEDGGHICFGDTLADDYPSPLDSLAATEIREHVEQALRQVPEPFRTVLVLRDIEGLSYEEVAEIVNTHLGTVKSRLVRGRAALKALLSDYVSASSPGTFTRARALKAGTAALEEL